MGLFGNHDDQPQDGAQQTPPVTPVDGGDTGVPQGDTGSWTPPTEGGDAGVDPGVDTGAGDTGVGGDVPGADAPVAPGPDDGTTPTGDGTGTDLGQ